MGYIFIVFFFCGYDYYSHLGTLKLNWMLVICEQEKCPPQIMIMVFNVIILFIWNTPQLEIIFHYCIIATIVLRVVWKKCIQ